MRLRSIFLILSLALMLGAAGCSRKPASDNSNAASDNANNANNSNPGNADTNSANQQNQAPAPKPPLVVPSGTTVTISLGTALGSKLGTPPAPVPAELARPLRETRKSFCPQSLLWPSSSRNRSTSINRSAGSPQITASGHACLR